MNELNALALRNDIPTDARETIAGVIVSSP
jgi:hypothetical protein